MSLPRLPPEGIATRQRLVVCVAAVLAAHAALLGTPHPPGLWISAGRGDGGRPAAVLVQRPDAAGTAKTAETAAAPQSPPAATAGTGSPTGDAAAAPAPAAPPASGTQFVERIEPPRIAASGASVEGLADPELYLPRSALTQGASAIGTIQIDYPPEAPAGQYGAELTLFIDEAGTVRRVRIDRSDAPPLLQDAARQAFLSARFLPGELYGRPVRSRMHIEVEFSAETLPALPAAAEAAASATAR